jgi:hypothetical protein
MVAAVHHEAPSADRPVVVCDVAHPQDACVQFFGSDGMIRAARLTVLGARPYLENGQPMPLPQAFAMLEAQAAERQAAPTRRRVVTDAERHGLPDPWDGEEEPREVQRPAPEPVQAGGAGGGGRRLVVEMVKPPVVK